MVKTNNGVFIWGLYSLMLLLGACDSNSLTGGGAIDRHREEREVDSLNYYQTDQFVMGADLSYATQIMDHGGTFKVSGTPKHPYRIFYNHGTNMVRFRLWHHPKWIRNKVYQDSTKPLYGGLTEVARDIRKAKQIGLEVLLDFHYSDFWADPGTQRVPEDWHHISSLDILKDSVYQYTRRTLQHLNKRGLMPEMVQIGNEINCGMLYDDAPSSFPTLNVCEQKKWKALGAVLQRAIQAVREVSANSNVDTRIALHIAQPEHVAWWVDNIIEKGGVSDFDIVGFSYYPPWSDVPVDRISNHVQSFSDRYNKEVMIMETAYAWTMDWADDYNNMFGPTSLREGYPATKSGQLKFMTDLVKEVIDGGGDGIFYWEPDWITSDMKTMWGKGSAWENNAFFTFRGNLHKGIRYMTKEYIFETETAGN